MYECVSGEEILGLLGRFKPLHLPLSPPCRPMRVLGAIVEIAALSVLDAGKQMALLDAVASQLVGHEHPRLILQSLQQSSEEVLVQFELECSTSFKGTYFITLPIPRSRRRAYFCR